MTITKTTEQTTITGLEPCLSASRGQRGQQRLSLRGLATTLNMLPPESVSVQVLEAALRSEAFYVRRSAAEILGRRGDRDARLVMQKALSDPQAPTRASAARHLHGFSWFSAEPLVRQALRDTDHRVREFAVYALCDMRDLHAFETLTDALQNEEDIVRLAAAWSLRDCKDAAAVPVLTAVLLAADPEARVKALEALGANGTPEAIAPVRQALRDPHPDVIYAATLSLLELLGEVSLQEIATVIEQTSGTVRAEILRGFFHASNYLKFDVANSPYVEPLIDALSVALHDEHLETRRATIWPLAWVKHQRAPVLLQEAYFRESDFQLKSIILRVAVSLMTVGNETLLTDALYHENLIVRKAAEKIVQEQGQGTSVRR